MILGVLLAFKARDTKPAERAADWVSVLPSAGRNARIGLGSVLQPDWAARRPPHLRTHELRPVRIRPSQRRLILTSVRFLPRLGGMASKVVVAGGVLLDVSD